jgi:hypothetical protein
MDHVLKSREPRKRLHALKTIPKDMFAAYEDIIGKIRQSESEDSELAFEIMSWLFHAPRILHMKELLEALVIEDGDHDLDRDCLLTREAVVECCKSLISYDSSTDLVQFAHVTVQEFMGSQLSSLLRPIDLANICLTYLLFEIFEVPCTTTSQMQSRHEKYAFAFYAAQFWAYHVRGEPELDPRLTQKVTRVIESQDRRDAILQACTYAETRSIQYPNEQHIFHFLARCGLAKFITRITSGLYALYPERAPLTV